MYNTTQCCIIKYIDYNNAIKKRGTKLPPEDPGKPFTPIEIHPQLCYQCGGKLEHGDDAIAHMVNPIAWCIPCAGEKEKVRADLCRAIVRGERDEKDEPQPG
jgi:hypothetical protein